MGDKRGSQLNNPAVVMVQLHLSSFAETFHFVQCFEKENGSKQYVHCPLMAAALLGSCGINKSEKQGISEVGYIQPNHYVAETAVHIKPFSSPDS